MAKLQEACGVFGVYDISGESLDAARSAYFGLFALQHRGQQSAGIAVNYNGTIFNHRAEGLVVEVFDEMTLNVLKGSSSIGHVRYPSQGGEGLSCAQPMLIKSRNGQIALAHNGTITNAQELRSAMEEQGAIFQSNSDAEVMLAMLGRNSILTDRIEDAIFLMMTELKGSYALTIMNNEKIIGVRDPLGIRPLCLGKVDNKYILASESCAIDALGGEFVRDVDPGEVVSISKDGVKSEFINEQSKIEARKAGSVCLFEFVYFARPDSVIDGCNVYESRIAAGRELARQHPVEADIVIGAPDSGLMAAQGFAEESGIPYKQGILKNRYVGRTFIQPTQLQREFAVALKFSALRSSVAGKKLVMVDDSIVRGTTTRHVVTMLRDAGATEVHLRVASPPVCYPCFYGVDTPMQTELSAANMTKEALAQMIGADSIEFISLEGLMNSLPGTTIGHCQSCFTGNYAAGLPSAQENKLKKVDLKEQGYTA
jgi:amidophosphoribosyltransferase